MKKAQNSSDHSKHTSWILWGCLTLASLVTILIVGTLLNDLERQKGPLYRPGLASDVDRCHLDPDDEPESDEPVPAGHFYNKIYENQDGTGRYHLFMAGIDFSEPVGLVVRLHGDGATEFDDPQSFLTCLANISAEHNYVFLSPEVPGDDPQRRWWVGMTENLRWLEGLLQDEIFNALPVDPERVWWMGYSGGAEFISYGILLDAVHLVSQGALMLGGGGAPDELNYSVSAQDAANMQLYWVTGELDDGSTSEATFNAKEAAQQGSEWYLEHGLQHVEVYFPSGHDHFSLPEAELLDRALARSH